MSTENIADDAIQELATDTDSDFEVQLSQEDTTEIERRYSFDEGDAKEWIETNLNNLTLNEEKIEDYLINDYTYIPKKYSSRCLHLRMVCL